MHVCGLVCVYVYVCVSVWLIWWFGGQPKQTGMAFVAWEGGCTASVSYTVVAHTHTYTQILEYHTQMPLTQTHAHTHSMQTTLPVAFQMPPGLFLSICGDRMTTLPPTTWAEPCRTTHIQEHHTRGSTETRRFPAEKQHESCLSNWQHSSQTNKQAVLRWTQWHI